MRRSRSLPAKTTTFSIYPKRSSHSPMGVGRVIVLKGVTCRPALLDSARLDDFVNRWTAPRIRNIVSKREADDLEVQ
jgi:hypothetical protein